DLSELRREDGRGCEGEAHGARDPRGDFQEREGIRQIDHQGRRGEDRDDPEQVRKAIKARRRPDESEDGKAAPEEIRAECGEEDAAGSEDAGDEEEDRLRDDDYLEVT